MSYTQLEHLVIQFVQCQGTEERCDSKMCKLQLCIIYYSCHHFSYNFGVISLRLHCYFPFYPFHGGVLSYVINVMQYGGDISRKMKLLKRQKEGKKRMKLISNVELSKEAFLSVLEKDS